MLLDLQSLIEQLGQVPSKTEVKSNLPWGPRHYAKQFGSLERACQLAGDQASPGPESNSAELIAPCQPRLARTKRRRRYGQIIGFEGLHYAPTNESGVVFLFGILAARLGYVVESIREEFPDCEAKRPCKDGTFEGISIEFEFRSSGFQRHGHDPDGCDLILCWEHDWLDCPVEVLELKREVQKRIAQRSGE